MRFVQNGVKAILLVLVLLATTRCGIVKYPGQPGVATNGFSKIDLEYLEAPGLFAYEVVYDNRPGGKGVGAIVTKLYPNAKTFTSNVRTNADGTVYRTKQPYNGAEVQMIAIPALKQIHLNPNHKVTLQIGYETSLDEIDDKNISEEGLFKPLEMSADFVARAFEAKKLRWDLLRAGSLQMNGNLSYEIQSLEMTGQKFTPSKPIGIETGLFQNSVRADVTAEVKGEFIQFLEANFPKGYDGLVNFTVKGQPQPVAIRLSVNTFKTLEASGHKIIRDASDQLVQQVLEQFQPPKK
jgi:hypothetical protein